jgi:site-specific DNA recombinase
VSVRVAKSDASWSEDTQNGSHRAVLYLRVSTKEQAEKGGESEGYSIPAQREAGQRQAAALGAVVVEEFADRGESGTNMRRPELQRMLAYVKAEPVDYVIVHKFDRLARNLADDVSISVGLKAAGARVISCSEAIEDTPTGEFMRTILSGMAAFYSRNLGLEVVKGATQKAKLGGTIGKAPLGYLNVRRIDDNGRELRTVEVDPIRGPLMKWAFEAYATGEWSVQRLLDELTRQGLQTVPTAKRPTRSLYLSHLHKLLRHPYYKGTVRYRGVEYEGRHEPLISAHTWHRVQETLSAHNHAGDRPRTHNHYLKGTVFCGKRDPNGLACGSRLIVTHARSRSGRIYRYFVCSSRHCKRTSCTFKAVLIDAIEDKIIEHYALHQFTAVERDALGQVLGKELTELRNETAAERANLLRRKSRLLTEREKLLQAHYAEAVPLELLKSEQARISEALNHIEQRLVETARQQERHDIQLKAALALATDTQVTYQGASDPVRRKLNQVMFEKIFVEEDGELSSVLAEPFDLLLSPEVRRLVASALPAVARRSRALTAPTTKAPAGWRAPRVGLNKRALVGAGGFEPP